MDESYQELFFKHCCRNDIRNVQQTIDSGFYINNDDLDGFTGLQIASIYGHEELVKILLTHGADIDKCNNLGFTPLMHAVCNSNFRIIDTLLERGADLNRSNHYGFDALSMAIAKGEAKVVKLLVSFGSKISKGFMGITPLMIAAVFDHQHLISYFKHQGIDVNETTSKGVTALMMAAVTNNKATLKALLDRRANPRIKNCRNETALDVAIALDTNQQLDQPLMKDYLLRKMKRKVDEAAKNELLQHVINGNYDEVCNLLRMDFLLSNTIRKEDGISALMLASSKGDLNMVDILCKFGANTNLQDNDGWTALMWAALNCHKECCDNLLKISDPYIRNRNGLTVADIVSVMDCYPTENLFMDFLLINDGSSQRLSADKLENRKKASFFSWLRKFRRKKSVTSDEGSSKVHLKGNILQNSIPVQLHMFEKNPMMNSMNFKLRGNDIKIIEVCSDEVTNKYYSQETITAESEHNSDEDSVSSIQQMTEIRLNISNKYDIKTSDGVSKILGKTGFQAYIRRFEEELVERDDLKNLEVSDLQTFGVRENDINELLLIFRNLN